MRYRLISSPVRSAPLSVALSNVYGLLLIHWRQRWLLSQIPKAEQFLLVCGTAVTLLGFLVPMLRVLISL
jgi:hypothetical protein